MIDTWTTAYEKGRAAGFKYGMFCRHNPYCPKVSRKQFEEWEAGFSKGYQERGWL